MGKLDSMTVLRSDRPVIQENAVHRNWQWSSVSKVEGRIRHPCEHYSDTSLIPILREHNVIRVPPTDLRLFEECLRIMSLCVLVLIHNRTMSW